MKRASHPRTLILLTFMVYGFVSLGCEGDGPEFVGGEDTVIIEGILLVTEVSQTDFFIVTRTGTVGIQVSSLEELDAGTGLPSPDPILGISIGQPDPEDADICQLTFSKTLAEGESMSVYYPEGLYCVTATRVAGSLETHTLQYVLTLTGAFS